MENKVKIPNSKGKNISAVIQYPEKETEKLAIICPGFLDTKDYANLSDLANKLCAQGYTSVRFDPMGTWDSDGDISEYNNTQYLKDIKNVLEYMLKDHNYTNILLGGHSRGGQISILYAARDPRITQVVAIMPSSNRTLTSKRYDDWKKNGFSIAIREIPNSEKVREFKVPYSHVEDRTVYDVYKDIKKIHIPIIFIAGELDALVLPKDVRELYEIANEPKKFVLIKGIDHEYRHVYVDIEKVNNEIVSCLKIKR